jgi:DNA-binding NarL/FixJ family response regulator
MRQCCPSAQIVVLTAYEWGLEAEARALGVAAFLRKEVASDTVLHTIAGLFPSTPADTPPPVLSQREAEVARLAAAGLSNPEISRALYISENTVKTHLAHILQKLQLGSRVDLARRWPIGV